MSESKPLHVQVAEALTGFPGCSCSEAENGFNTRTGKCLRCGGRAAPRYDTAWAATGPLIEKYGISIDRQEDYERLPGREWLACDPRPSDRSKVGPTPLIAVCRLILALKEAGKL